MTTRDSHPPCHCILYVLLGFLVCAIVVFADKYPRPQGGQLIILFACVNTLVFFVYVMGILFGRAAQEARVADALTQSLRREEEKPEMTWEGA
jgi:hypothetical protein